MVTRACLDTGPISLYYQKNPPREVEQLIKDIKGQKIQAHVPKAMLIEVYKHLCVAGGNDYAESCIRSFLHNVRIDLVSLTPELILETGRLKCQYRAKLSYNDCIAVALALQRTF